MTDQQLEDTFEKACKEYSQEHPEDSVLRRAARFFFFAGAGVAMNLAKEILAKEIYENATTSDVVPDSNGL